MKYSKETLRKFAEMARGMINQYKENVPGIKVCISKGNRKIGHTMNVSLLPVFTCANCKECKNYCYDIKACMQYKKNVLPARVRNTVLARENEKEYFAQIEKALKARKKNFFFRWHVAGDIISESYLDNMIRLAIAFPHFIFWTYTKNYNLVNRYVSTHGNDRRVAIPGNLSIMFSEWKGMDMPNPYNFPVFKCIFPGEKFPRGFHKCSGNCNDCIANKTGCVAGKSSATGLH